MCIKRVGCRERERVCVGGTRLIYTVWAPLFQIYGPGSPCSRALGPSKPPTLWLVVSRLQQVRVGTLDSNAEKLRDNSKTSIDQACPSSIHCAYQLPEALGTFFVRGSPPTPPTSPSATAGLLSHIFLPKPNYPNTTLGQRRYRPVE